jgi:hypothetical protein
VDYRIAPTRIPGRSGRSVVAIASALAVVVGLGLAILTVTSVGSDPDLRVAVKSGSPRPIGAIPVAKRPPDVRCHGIGPGRCTEIAAAAVGAIIDPTLPPATSVEVWASLLCGSTFDCPPYHLADRRPAGSAVVTVGGIVLWVNVTEIVRPEDRGSQLPTLDAWVIPSGPAS